MAQQLTHHTTPVLSLCTVPLPVLPATNPQSSHLQDPQHPANAAEVGRSNTPDQRLGSRGNTQLVWSGATNGSFAAWLVTVDDHTELHDHQHNQQSHQPQGHPQQQHLQQQPVHQQQQQRPQLQAQPQETGRQHGRLLWSAEHWHQSGINCLHAAPTAGTSPQIPPRPPPTYLSPSHPHPTSLSCTPPPHPQCRHEYCCTLPLPYTVHCIAHTDINWAPVDTQPYFSRYDDQRIGVVAA